MTATEVARRSDALYEDNSGGMTRRTLCDMVAQREAEIAELRELMRELYYCATSGKCYECSTHGAGPVHFMPDTLCDIMHDHMRELGIEVGE